MNISQAEIAQLNEYANFLSFKETWQFRMLMNSKSWTVLMLSGNQAGKTSSVARHYVMRFMGLHPIAEKNSDYFVCKNDHKQAIVTAPDGSFDGKGRCKKCDEKLELYCEPPFLRIYRFASQNMPGVSGEDRPEVRNTQHPELLKWLPPYLIKRNINSRSPVMSVKDINGGAEIVIEFVSYGQDVQSVAGQQRKSLWADEEAPYDFMEEQYPRLFMANGDIVFSMTAANKISWMYDEFFEKASITDRSDKIIEAPVIKQLFGSLQKHEVKKTGKDIHVIQFASDDNPTMQAEVIDERLANIDDPNTLARRRYGMFAQASGRVLKNFRYDAHFLSMDKTFPDGIPQDWLHARGIDYHQRNDWHFGAVSLSNHNEMFIWCEGRYSPELLDIEETAKAIAEATDDIYYFSLNVIDPLANTIQGNKRTTVQDLNRRFSELKRKGIGTGGYWTPWDTKSLKGREQLRLRLKNSIRCKRPFNNIVSENGKTVILPTIWVMDTCPEMAKYLRMWRHEENKGRDDTATKDENENVQQKWSHYPMVLEGILKERSFEPNLRQRMLLDRDVPQRFTGARR